MTNPKYVKRANQWVVSWREWRKDRYFTIQEWFATEEKAKQFIQNNGGRNNT